MSQLSVTDQHEVDTLNDDIRRLKQENKEAFIARMKLEADKSKLENLLTNNYLRRKEELVQVQLRFFSRYSLFPVLFCQKLNVIFMLNIFTGIARDIS